MNNIAATLNRIKLKIVRENARHRHAIKTLEQALEVAQLHCPHSDVQPYFMEYGKDISGVCVDCGAVIE